MSSNGSEISEVAQFVSVWGCISCIPVCSTSCHTHAHIYTYMLRPTEYKGPRLVLCAQKILTLSEKLQRTNHKYVSQMVSPATTEHVKTKSVCVYLRWKALSLHTSPYIFLLQSSVEFTVGLNTLSICAENICTGNLGERGTTSSWLHTWNSPPWINIIFLYICKPGFEYWDNLKCLMHSYT